jgi:hypothetical protein
MAKLMKAMNWTMSPMRRLAVKEPARPDSIAKTPTAKLNGQTMIHVGTAANRIIQNSRHPFLRENHHASKMDM